MKLAVAGAAGELGTVICQSAVLAQGVELCARCDVRPIPHAPPGAFTARGWEELIETKDQAQWNTLALCLPQSLQGKAASCALGRGIDVLMPLPIALCSQELRELKNLAQSTGAKLIPALYDRFFGNVEDVGHCLKRGEIGKIGTATLRRYAPAQVGSGWRGDTEQSGGAVWQLLFCDLMIASFWFGEIKSAFGHIRKLDGVEIAAVTATMGTGELVHCQAAWGAGDRFLQRYELSGQDGNIVYDSCTAHPVRWSGGDKPKNAALFDLALCNRAVNPYQKMLESATQMDQQRADSSLEEVLRISALLEHCFAEREECDREPG